MRSIVLLPLLGLVALAGAQSPDDVKAGLKIVDVYRAFRIGPRADPKISKALQIENEVSRLRNLEKVSPAEAADLAPRYVALCALQLEVGGSWATGKSPIEASIQARYGPEVRRRWSPEAQRLWLEAFYVHRDRAFPALRLKLDALRKEGANVEPLEARTLALDIDGPEMIERRAETCLRYAESHPDDIVATLTAGLYLDSLAFDLTYQKKKASSELRSQIARLFTLENRTLDNLSRLLNEQVKGLRIFASIRDRKIDRA